MGTFTGSDADEIITPKKISPTVAKSGGARPGDGADSIFGGGGNDTIDAGGGNDSIDGGTGNDSVIGGDGDDTILWNPGGGDDTVDGGAGSDVLSISGDGGADTILVSAGLADPINLALNGVANTISLTNVELVQVSGGAGDDFVSASGSTRALSLNGGGGDDTVVGGSGADTVTGGAGNDVLDGGFGADVLDGGGGDDVIVWNPGGGSDTVDGAAGLDVLQFNGANASEQIALVGSDRHVILTRDVGLVTMDLDNVEHVAIAARGGADTITVGDLGHTDVTQVDVDLSALGGGGAGDGQADVVQVGGFATNDRIVLATADGATTVDGLPTVVSVSGADSLDRLAVSGGAGDDTVDATALAGGITVNFDGGAGADVLAINGGGGADQILVSGGSATPEGDLVVFSVNGAASGSVNVLNVETVAINTGAGDDEIRAASNLSRGIVVDAGDGADTVVGGSGADTVIGGAGNDVLDGGLGADVFDGGAGDDVIIWNPGEGSDTVDGGSGVDTLQFNAANISERIALAGSGGHAILTRDVGAVRMDLDNVERVAIAARGGSDVVTVDNLSGTGVTQVDVDLSALGDGGAGDGQADVVQVGGVATNDRIVLATADGATTVDGLPAVVSVSGADSLDRLAVVGGAGDDTVDATALAGGITVNFDGGAGADVLAINGGGGADQILVSGGSATPEGDLVVFSVNGAASGSVNVLNVETVAINTGAGDDEIRAASNLSRGIVVDAGDGADTVVGGSGADTVIGGAGNDVLDGGFGADVLDGGDGNDVIIWNPGGGSDTVDGGSGVDTLQFNGSNGGEVISLSAASNGHVVLTRDVGGVTMDIDNVERLSVAALGGADEIMLGNLAGTKVQQVDIDLGVISGDDGQPDTVFVGAGGGDDQIILGGSADTTTVSRIVGVELNVSHGQANDHLVIDGGTGNDTLDASAFADKITVDFDGGAGLDTFVVNGGLSGDNILVSNLSGTATAATINVNNGGAVNLVNVETISVDGGVGDDVISTLNVTHALALTGGAGADTVIGGAGADTVDGGSGDDLLDGGFGADVLDGGDGNDVIIWNPGGGSDTVDGGAGVDTLQFNMSNAGESVDLSAVGGHAILTRNIGAVTMDIDNVETIAIGGAGGGADVIFIHDLTGTDVKQVDVDLVGPTGTGDTFVDILQLQGGSLDDHLVVSASGDATVITGLGATVNLNHAENLIDQVAVSGGDGNDSIDASSYGGAGNVLTLTGDRGDDVLIGSRFADFLIGGDGRDTLTGGDGTDRFVFVAGVNAQDEILDFQSRAGGGADVVSLQGYADHSLADLVGNHHIVQSGADVVITEDGLTLTLKNVTLSSLVDGDFLFG